MDQVPDNLLPIIVIGGTEIKLSDLLRINPSNMQKEFEMVSGWIGTISYHYGIAKLKVDRQERLIKAMEASLSKKTRNRMTLELLQAVAENSKRKATPKPTETQIKQEWINDPELSEEFKKLDALTAHLVSLEAAKQGLNAKKDMIVNLGAEIRKDRR